MDDVSLSHAKDHLEELIERAVRVRIFVSPMPRSARFDWRRSAHPTSSHLGQPTRWSPLSRSPKTGCLAASRVR
jgi:hypothetical protein